jgi:hypothetical protein
VDFGAELAYDNVTGFDGLAAETFDASALAVAVATVF